MTWIKMIKIIFHVFDSSNNLSQVIWVKSKSNPTNISSDQTKTKNLVHDTSRTNMWFESNHLMIQVRWEFNSSHIPWFESNIFHVYHSKFWKKMRFHNSSQGCVWIKSWFELRTCITWILVFIQITNFWLESFYVEF